MMNATCSYTHKIRSVSAGANMFHICSMQPTFEHTAVVNKLLLLSFQTVSMYASMYI